ncbi:MAG TPA: cytochrome c maturation protein CcmE [Bacteroidota bacterium]|jgi:cytochrome c-type biogenesis protein CcmE|nr:cytochrome c maturation protein CcmE [Bacteroidota bacterium]
MKTRYIIGGIIIVVFLLVAVFSLVNTDIEYSDFSKARELDGKKIQIKGQWVREKGSEYNSEKNEFIFYLKDENNEIAKVIFSGSKPNNFEIASHVVAIGKYKDGIFYSSEILTKCPSKYEGQKYTP